LTDHCSGEVTVLKIVWETESPLPGPGDSGGAYFVTADLPILVGMHAGTFPDGSYSIAVPFSTVDDFLEHMGYQSICW